MTKSNPFDHQPNVPEADPNTVDPATNATGPAPMPANLNQGEYPSVSKGTEGWGLGKDEPSTSGQSGRKNKVDQDAA